MTGRNSAEFWIENLKMKPHPEGGFWSLAFRSDEIIRKESLQKRFNGDRNFYSSIYFLLQGNDFSALHRLKADEVWHFYSGCALTIYTINLNGFITVRQLGNDPELQESFQFLAPAGNWIGAKPTMQDSYSLMGCTMSPAFDERDWELGKREELIRQFPQHAKLIESLTR